jgi:acyl-CoA synthetase (AMP-forming)/AMP-acid ligase II
MLGALAAEASRRFGDRAAFVAAGTTVTYRDLHEQSDALAAGLSASGIGPGDVVALGLGTVPAYPVCYLAAAKLGAITAGVNTRLAMPERERVLERAGPALLIAGDGFCPDWQGNRVSPEQLAGVARTGAAPPALEPDPERPVAVVFTSGTTGAPKGAVFGERQLDAIRRIDVGDAWGAGGAVLLGTSLAHLGFMTKLPGALQSGRTNHLMPRWRAAEALTLTSRLGLTSLSGVPTQLALMLAEPAVRDLDFGALRLVLIGGGPATPDLVRRAREAFGVPVCTRYSCTEAGIGCGTFPADPAEDAEQTVGRPQPGVELGIRGPHEEDVPPGEVGEVVLRSAAAMSGYWRDPEATAAAFTRDGFVRTGDLGRLDEQGRLHLVGRSKEIYVRGGYNVHPVAVEAVLSRHPAVRAVAVVPRPDEVLGEIGVAVVVPEGAPPTLEQLRDFAANDLARHELPERLLPVDRLPLTAGDKLDRRVLRALVRDRVS